MKAVQYRFSWPGFLLARTLARYWPALYYGRLSNLSLVDLAEPRLQGPDWARIRPVFAGICGTDLGTITARQSPILSPFVSFPSVLGHEVVARVEEVGPQVTGVEPGDRVVVDPFLSCAARGLDPCPSCRRGMPSLCENQAEGSLPPGMLLGFTRSLPGAWSEGMVVHASQIYPVPPDISDERAVLVEPLSVALHGVLRRRPPAGARVLIIGGGSIGLMTLAALRLLEVPCHITLLGRHAHQRELAGELGADAVFPSGRDGAFTAAEEITGARRYQPLVGRPVLAGGFDHTFDCVGSQKSLDDSLRVTRPGGAITLVGGAGQIPRLDWTFIWAREIDVIGSCGYGRESYGETNLHTMDLALTLLREHPDFPLERLLTHRFPLSRYREAIHTTLARGRHRVIKTVFVMDKEREAGKGTF